MFLCFSDLWFPHLSGEDNNSYYPIRESINVHKSLSIVHGAHWEFRGPSSPKQAKAQPPLLTAMQS